MNTIIPIIESKIPNFVKKEYPIATQLILDLYKFLEQSNNPLDILNSLITDVEINTNDSKFETLILGDLNFNIKDITNIDKRIIVTTLKDFYMSRGSVNSFKYLYRLIYDKDVSITYPRNNWFSLSDRNNNDDYYIITSFTIKGDKRFEDLFDNSFLDIIITGITSNSIIIVNSITPLFLNNNFYLKIGVNKTKQRFVPREQLKIEYNNKQFFEVIYEITIPHIFDGGILYQKGDTIILNNHYVSGRIIVDDVSMGHIDSIFILNGGTGYVIGDIITSSYGNGFNAFVSSVDNNGVINGITILNHGNNYTKLPDLQVISINGINALLNPITNSIGKIKRLKVLEPYFKRHESFNITNDCYIETSSGVGAILTLNDNGINNCLLKVKKDNIHSNDMLLHDSNKINQFSYEIRSSIPLELSQHLIEEHCHQAGTIGFNIVDIIENIVISSNFDDMNNIGIY